MTYPVLIQRSLSVAQVSNLLCRRLPRRQAVGGFTTLADLEIRDTAGWKSALRRAATNYCAMLVIPAPKITLA
jgi:hypothetical protein